MLAAGGRIVVKLVSSEVAHKSDLGGVALDVATPVEAEAAARAIAARAEAAGVALDGFALQPMVRRPGAIELIAGLGRDPVFGPVILFGAGGVAVELLRRHRDRAAAARRRPRRRAGRPHPRRPPARRLPRPTAGRRRARSTAALVALSHLAEDFPCIRSADVNPLIADAEGVLALDAQMVIEPADIDRPAPNPDLAIRPYPAGWRGTHARRRRLRHPADPAEDANSTAPSSRAPTGGPAAALSRAAPQLPRGDGASPDPARLRPRDGLRRAHARGRARRRRRALACDPDHVSGEYATIVRSDLKGRGLGGALMRMLIDYAAADGLGGSRASCSRRTARCSASSAASAFTRHRTPTIRRWS